MRRATEILSEPPAPGPAGSRMRSDAFHGLAQEGQALQKKVAVACDNARHINARLERAGDQLAPLVATFKAARAAFTSVGVEAELQKLKVDLSPYPLNHVHALVAHIAPSHDHGQTYELLLQHIGTPSTSPT